MDNSEPQPGDENIQLEQLNSIPYTHREIFLAADNAVGMGLHTHSDLDENGEYSTQLNKLQEKETLEEIFNSWEAEGPIRVDDMILNELLDSEYIKVNNENKINTAYIEQKTQIDRYTNKTLNELTTESKLKSFSTEEIKLLLGTKLPHEELVSDIQTVSQLIKLNRNWLEYWKNFGTVIGKETLLKTLDDEAIDQIAIWATDGYEDRTEGDVDNVKSVKNYYHNDSRINSLLNEPAPESKLTESSPVVTNHPTAIRSITNTQNAYKSRPNTYNGSIIGNYNNRVASGLLHYSENLRKTIAAKRCDKDVTNFEMTDLFDPNEITNRFWSVTMGDELLRDAYQATAHESGGENASSSIDVGNSITLTSAYYDPTATAPAIIRTNPIDVSNKSKITISIGNAYTRTTRDVTSKVIIKIKTKTDTEQKVWKDGNNPTKEHMVEFNDKNKIQLIVKSTAAGAIWDYGDKSDTVTSSIEINNIEIT